MSKPVHGAARYTRGFVLIKGKAMRALWFAVFLLFASAGWAADPNSYAEPDKVRVADLGLDVNVDFARKELIGRADLRLDWRDPAQRDLLLDTRDLAIDRVLGKSGDGGWRRLRWELAAADPILGSKLSIHMRRQYAVVRIHYRTSPRASGLQWLEPAMTAGGKHPFLFSQSQAIHARSWVPIQDTPAVRFTYSAHVRTPPELMALMSADNDPDAARDGDYVFRMPQPIPSYLLAIAVGDLSFAPLSARAGVWAEPSVLAAAAAEFADTEKMIATAESLYGPYRWGRYDLLVLPPSFPFGGMENPRLTFATPTVIVGDKSLVSLVAHELAHSWSGNLVTNASWKDMWLNEGFTSYVENRLVEAIYGVEQARMESVIAQYGLQQELKELKPAYQLLAMAPLTGADPDAALSDVPYVKGAWFLSFLEQRFGRERFDAFLRDYFDHFAFQSIDTEAFVGYLREHLLALAPDVVSAAELDAWLHQPGIPAFAKAAVSSRFAAVDQAAERWLKQRLAAHEIDSKGWSTQEWVHFLERMPKKLSARRLLDLDEAFKLTGSANGEIAQRWYPLAERSGYFEARPAMAAFLKKVGRRKLVLPTWEALAATRDGREFARKVFAEARAGMHPITAASVQGVLDGKH